MYVSVDLIIGASIGIEYVPAIEEEEIPDTLILDVLFVRILIHWA